MLIEKSFDNKEIIKLNCNSKDIYLGSKYNMTREVESFKEQLMKINKTYQVIIFGAAGGQWIKELKEYFEERHVLFIEPLNELKERLMNSIENMNENIKVLSLENEDFKDELKKAISKRFVEFIVFSNYDLVFPKEAYTIKQNIKEIIIDKTINENTRLVFAKDWFENYLENLPVILKSENLNHYKDVYNSKPAIIVSAGPSLEKNLHFLKENEDNFIIITGIRTLSTLRKEGIKCDFTCVIDGSEDMYEVAKDALNEEVPLFFSESANRKIIQEYKGKKIYFTSPNYRDLNLRLGSFGTDLIYQGGSVAHSCLAIANYLGCNPMIFIGQDLAYTNNQLHSSNATIEGEKLVADKFDLYVKDINGKDVPTSYALESFKKTFENFIKVYNNKVYINATEGGANIEGTQVKNLIEVINQYGERIDKTYIKKDKQNNLDADLILEQLRINLFKLSSLNKFAREAVIENENLIKNFSANKKKFKKSLERLDYIDKIFNENSEQFLLLNSLFSPIIKEIDIAFYDDRIGNFSDELEHIRFISEKGKKLYKNIIASIEFSVPYIENTIRTLEETNCE